MLRRVQPERDVPSDMLRDDILIDDNFQADAYGPFRTARSRGARAVAQPHNAFYGLLALALMPSAYLAFVTGIATSYRT